MSGEHQISHCPFCGFSDAKITIIAVWFEIQCGTCGARSGLCHTETKTVDAWNTRAVMPQRVREISCLSSLLGYATTCREANTEDWMDGLKKRINLTLEAMGDDDRVETDKDGLKLVQK